MKRLICLLFFLGFRAQAQFLPVQPNAIPFGNNDRYVTSDPANLLYSGTNLQILLSGTNNSGAFPAYSFTGANNNTTGMYLAATETLGFSTNGIPRAYIDGSGIFGVIGSLNVDGVLNVTGNILATSVNSVLNVKAFGAKGDGITDDTAAVMLAISSASQIVLQAGSGIVVATNAEIYWPPGSYLISGSLIYGQGIENTGADAVSAGFGYGTSIMHASNGDLFVFNNATGNIGGGGGVRNFNIYKQTGFSGGSAIAEYSTSSIKRGGVQRFENIFIGSNGGFFGHGIYVDGSNATTLGSQGIRDLYFSNVRISSTNIADQYVFLQDAVHLRGDIETDQGSGATQGITITGSQWDDINIWGLRAGTDFNVSYSGSSFPYLYAQGTVNNFSNTSPSVHGEVHLSVDSSLIGVSVSNASTQLQVYSDFGPTGFVSSSGGTISGSLFVSGSVGIGGGFLDRSSHLDTPSASSNYVVGNSIYSEIISPQAGIPIVTATMPSSPSFGQLVNISCSGMLGITSFVVVANAGQFLQNQPPTSSCLVPPFSRQWIWNSGLSTWFFHN